MVKKNLIFVHVGMGNIKPGEITNISRREGIKTKTKFDA